MTSELTRKAIRGHVSEVARSTQNARQVKKMHLMNSAPQNQPWRRHTRQHWKASLPDLHYVLCLLRLRGGRINIPLERTPANLATGAMNRSLRTPVMQGQHPGVAQLARVLVLRQHQAAGGCHPPEQTARLPRNRPSRKRTGTRQTGNWVSLREQSFCLQGFRQSTSLGEDLHYILCRVTIRQIVCVFCRRWELFAYRDMHAYRKIHNPTRCSSDVPKRLWGLCTTRRHVPVEQGGLALRNQLRSARSGQGATDRAARGETKTAGQHVQYL